MHGSIDINKKNILLHICCAPCSIVPIQQMRQEGANVSGYFFNPNIHPYTEYLKRRETVKEYTKIILLQCDIDTSYDLEHFLSGAMPRGKDRCLFCYRVRLEKTFHRAIEGGFAAVSTTLLYSKYQRHDDIRKIGSELSEEFDLPFIYRDFRKGWQEGISESKRLNMYRQQYCGCIFSEKERYLARK